MGYDRIIGHARPKKLIQSMLDNDRLPHALLFSGPPGVGKYTLAMEVVKTLFCEKQPACGRCRACQNVEHRTHPDLIVIESETSIGIENLRSLQKDIYQAPYEQKRRAIIIDGAEKMTRDAANALLKTLEEPPIFNVFMLVTSNEREIPLTIKSRCVRIGFGPLSRDDIRAYFRDVKRLDGEKAELTASLSDGSISVGLFWLDDAHLLVRQKLAEGLLGRKKSYILITLLAERIARSATEMIVYLHFLLSLLQDLWLLQAFDYQAAALRNSDMFDLLTERRHDSQWIVSSMNKVQETVRAIRYNISRWLAAEHLLISIMR
jgi:DNA polymerase III subunit delta'